MPVSSPTPSGCPTARGTQWRSQHQTALDQLEEAVLMIGQHETVLEYHMAAVEKIANGLEYHEKNLAESLHSGPQSGLDDSLRDRHAEIASLFRTHRDAHERIKRHHHVAIAHVASLVASLKAAM